MSQRKYHRSLSQRRHGASLPESHREGRTAEERVLVEEADGVGSEDIASTQDGVGNAKACGEQG